MPVIVIGAIVGLLVIFIALGATWAKRYVKVGPHEAMIIAGKGGQKVIIGGAMFVMPVLYKMFKLDLQAHKVDVSRKNIYTKERIPINVDAVLVYKVKGDEPSVKLAAQSLQEKNTAAIQELVQSVAEGAFRDICGKMSPEEINEDRETFQNKVTEVAKGHFERMGLDLVAFTVNHISDDKGYFENLGAPRAAAVFQTARQRKAEADRTATVTEVEQKRGSEVRRAETEAEILQAQKDRNVKEQQYKAETATETAKAEQAGPRASAVAEQSVVEEQTKLAEKQAERKQQELLSSVVRPAEAEKDARIAEAQGRKQAAVLEGEGKGGAAQRVGEGEAAAIKAKLIAEAEGLERKAEAMKKFNDAGMGLQVALAMIEQLPEIIKAAASPVAAIDKMQVIDFGNTGSGESNSNSPVARILDIPPQTIAKADASLKATLGIGLRDMIQLVRSGKLPGVLPAGETSEPTKEKD